VALRGTLEHLGLAGVFQLIGQNNRHGVLTVEHGAEQMNLFFAGGQLVRTEGTGKSREEAFGALLVAAQILDEAQLQGALAARSPQEPRLYDVLLGTLNAPTLSKFAALHSTEAVQRAFGWQTGSYAFLPAPEPLAGNHPGLRADHLLMEALQALDAWPALQAKVPHLHGVYGVARSLEDYLISQSMAKETAIKSDFDDAFGFGDSAVADAEGASHTVGLSHNDRLVYGLVDGIRDVQTLIDLSGLGTYRALTSLTALMDAQLVVQTEQISVRPSARDTVVLAAAPRAVRWRLSHLAPLALKGAFVAAALWLLAPPWQPPAPTWPHPFAPQPAFRLTWQQQAVTLMEHLEVVRARQGAYPQTLKPPLPQGSTVPLYAPTGAGYRLRRPLMP
jgi:hypothetical protein